MSAYKILTVHGSHDNSNEVVEKIKKLNAKSGPFDFCLLVGNNIQNQLSQIDNEGLPNIFVFDSECNLEPNDCKVEQLNKGNDSVNITSLKGCGLYRLANGLKIAYVTYQSSELSKYKERILEKFNKIDELNVDILVTHEWSHAIADLKTQFNGDNIIDQLVKQLQPRYHLVYSEKDIFTELEPFQWKDSDIITRFINIAEFGSRNKWAYAFQLKDLDDKQMEDLPANLIPNPYLIDKKRKRDTNKEDVANGKKLMKILPERCHFCFSNTDLEDHMIISINKMSYMTIAKGPLTIPKGDMNFSGHCLIIPIEHIPKLNHNQEDTQVSIMETDLVKELNNYEKSIVDMNYKKYDMSTISFEINSDRSIHYHRQIIPIPKYLILRFQSSLDRQCYFNNNKIKGSGKLEFEIFENGFEDPEYLKIVNDPTTNYMQFTVYETSEATPKIYVARFNVRERIDLQFPRRVIAFLLNLPKRVKWDSQLCLQTKEQETTEAQLFQKGYKPYDITADDV